MIHGLKRSLLNQLKRGHIFQGVAESRWRSERLLILCYHGISLEDEHEWKPTFSMAESDFESRLALLKAEGYSVLPLGEALNRLYAQTLPRKSVVITFDDGLYNFYAKAWPLLKQYGYPATLYLTTYYCFNNLPVFPLITSYLLWKKRGGTVTSNPSVGLNTSMSLMTEASRMDAWKAIQSYTQARQFSAQQKQDLVQALAAHLNVDLDPIMAQRLCHLMTPDEIKEISRNGVDIQLHTHRHRSPMDHAAFQQEIVDNRKGIEELTGQLAQHHCYPSGVTHADFLPWLSEQNVTSGATCDTGFAHARTNPLLLPRFLDAANVSAVEFESWLSGVGAFVPKNPFRPEPTLWYRTN